MAQWVLPTLLLLCVGVTSAADAAKPSFSCERATTPAERAICTHPALATGDVAVARSYRAALARLDAAAATALKADQRDFLALRDTLLDDDSSARDAGLPGGDGIADLASLQRERSALLDAVVASPAGAFDGTWKKLAGELSIQRDARGTLAVHLNATEPSAGRWVCEFAGHGSVDGEGRAVIRPDDGEGASLLLRRVGAALTVSAVAAASADSPELVYCGLNGSPDGSYFSTARKSASVKKPR